MKTPRYSFRVIIEQDDPQEGRNFGTKEEWAKLIQNKLNEYLSVANVVEVTPIRNK